MAPNSQTGADRRATDRDRRRSAPGAHPDLPLGSLPWNDLLVDSKRASLALSVVQGLLNDDPNAERMALEAFDSLEDAAMSYAYLVGFLIEDVAAARRLSVSTAIAELRTRLLG